LEGGGKDFHVAFGEFVSGKKCNNNDEIPTIETATVLEQTTADFQPPYLMKNLNSFTADISVVSKKIPKRNKPIEKDEEYNWGSPDNSEDETNHIENDNNDNSDYDEDKEVLSEDNDNFTPSRVIDSKKRKTRKRRRIDTSQQITEERFSRFSKSVNRPMTMTLQPDELLMSYFQQQKPAPLSIQETPISYSKKPRSPPELDSSRTKWTTEEDQRLREIIQSLFPDRSPSNWALIADTLGTKNANQCCQHWFRVLRPNIVRGPFTIEEEDKLLETVNNFGDGPIPWSKVAEELPGRVDLQCRNYYLQRKKSLSHNWSKQEDSVLSDLVIRSQNGCDWQNLSEELNQRTRSKRRGVIRSARECKTRSEILSGSREEN